METGSARIYNDFSGLGDLRLQAKLDPDAAAREVAEQFESIFVGMMMKSMRDATPKDGLFNSDQMEAYQEMFDKQLAVDLSAKGGLGLASMIEQQIAQRTAMAPETQAPTDTD